MADRFEGWQGAQRPTTELEAALMRQPEVDQRAFAVAYQEHIRKKMENGEKLTPEEAYVAKQLDFGNFMSVLGGAGALATGFASPFAWIDPRKYSPGAELIFQGPSAGAKKFARGALATSVAGLGMGLPALSSAEKHAAAFEFDRRQRAQLERMEEQGLREDQMLGTPLDLQYREYLTQQRRAADAGARGAAAWRSRRH